MKNVLIAVVCLFIGVSTLQAQSIDDVPLKTIDAEYVQIVGTSKMMSNKMIIQVDYGQETKMGTDTRVKNESGKAMDFHSMIDALNFFNKHGYEFVNAYSLSVNNQNVYHYILKKRKA